MLDIKLNNYFYNYVLDIIASLTLNSNTLQQKKLINIFPPLNSITKPQKLFDFQKSLLI